MFRLQIKHVEPQTEECLLPEKLASFYRSVGGDYDALFLDAPHASLSLIYRSLGCFHSLQPTPDPFAFPCIPALTPSGYLRWQTIQLLLDPAEHVPYLQKALQEFDILDPRTGNVFPRPLPREVFPDGPDREMEEWHDYAINRMRGEVDIEQDEVTLSEDKDEENDRAPEYVDTETNCPEEKIDRGVVQEHDRNGNGQMNEVYGGEAEKYYKSFSSKESEEDLPENDLTSSNTLNTNHEHKPEEPRQEVIDQDRGKQRNEPRPRRPKNSERRVAEERERRVDNEIVPLAPPPSFAHHAENKRPAEREDLMAEEMTSSESGADVATQSESEPEFEFEFEIEKERRHPSRPLAPTSTDLHSSTVPPPPPSSHRAARANDNSDHHHYARDDGHRHDDRDHDVKDANDDKDKEKNRDDADDDDDDHRRRHRRQHRRSHRHSRSRASSEDPSSQSHALPPTEPSTKTPRNDGVLQATPRRTRERDKNRDNRDKDGGVVAIDGDEADHPKAERNYEIRLPPSSYIPGTNNSTKANNQNNSPYTVHGNAQDVSSRSSYSDPTISSAGPQPSITLPSPSQTEYDPSFHAINKPPASLYDPEISPSSHHPPNLPSTSSQASPHTSEHPLPPPASSSRHQPKIQTPSTRRFSDDSSQSRSPVPSVPPAPASPRVNYRGATVRWSEMNDVYTFPVYTPGADNDSVASTPAHERNAPDQQYFSSKPSPSYSPSSPSAAAVPYSASSTKPHYSSSSSSAPYPSSSSLAPYSSSSSATPYSSSAARSASSSSAARYASAEPRSSSSSESTRRSRNRYDDRDGYRDDRMIVPSTVASSSSSSSRRHPQPPPSAPPPSTKPQTRLPVGSVVGVDGRRYVVADGTNWR